MKINWKVRLKNPVFWITFVPSIIALVYSILSALGIVPSITEDTLTSSVTSLVTALTTIGVLVDPTTSGVSDSSQAMSYETPKLDINEGGKE